MLLVCRKCARAGCCSIYEIQVPPRVHMMHFSADFPLPFSAKYQLLHAMEMPVECFGPFNAELIAY